MVQKNNILKDRKLLFILGFFAFVLIACSCVYLFKQGFFQNKNILAIVGEEEITRRDLNAQIYGRDFEGTIDNPEDVSEGEKKKELDTLIERKIAEIEGKKIGITISDDELQSEIEKRIGNYYEDYTDEQKELTEENIVNDLRVNKIKDKTVAWSSGEYILFRYGYIEDNKLISKTDKDYIKDVVSKVYEELKDGSISFDEARDRVLNDSEIGPSAFEDVRLNYYDNFSKEDFTNSRFLFYKEDLKEKVSLGKKGEVIEPVLASKKVENDEFDFAWVIFKIDDTNGGTYTSYEQWINEKKEEYKVKTYPTNIALALCEPSDWYWSGTEEKTGVGASFWYYDRAGNIRCVPDDIQIKLDAGGPDYNVVAVKPYNSGCQDSTVLTNYEHTGQVFLTPLYSDGFLACGGDQCKADAGNQCGLKSGGSPNCSWRAGGATIDILNDPSISGANGGNWNWVLTNEPTYFHHWDGAQKRLTFHTGKEHNWLNGKTIREEFQWIPNWTQPSKLEVLISSDPSHGSEVNPGDLITYKVIYTNHGEGSTGKITHVEVPVPSGTDFISMTEGRCNSSDCNPYWASSGNDANWTPTFGAVHHAFWSFWEVPRVGAAYYTWGGSPVEMYLTVRVKNPFPGDLENKITNRAQIRTWDNSELETSESVEHKVKEVNPHKINCSLSARPTKGDVTLTVEFTADVVDTKGHAIAEYYWNFDNGESRKTSGADANKIMYTYSTVGNFKATVTGTTGEAGVPTSSCPATVEVRVYSPGQGESGELAP